MSIAPLIVIGSFGLMFLLLVVAGFVGSAANPHRTLARVLGLIGLIEFGIVLVCVTSTVRPTEMGAYDVGNNWLFMPLQGVLYIYRTQLFVAGFMMATVSIGVGIIVEARKRRDAR